MGLFCPHSDSGQTGSNKPQHIPPHAATITKDQEYWVCTIDAQFGELRVKRRKYGSNQEQVTITVSVIVIVLAACIFHDWSNFMTLFFHSAGAVATPQTGHSQPPSTSASTTVDEPGKSLTSGVNYTLMSIKTWEALNSK